MVSARAEILARCLHDAHSKKVHDANKFAEMGIPLVLWDNMPPRDEYIKQLFRESAEEALVEFDKCGA